MRHYCTELSRVLCLTGTSHLALYHSLNMHLDLSAPWSYKEVSSPSDTILLSSHCACWAVIQPSTLTVLPAWDGMLWHVAVVCPLQPRGKLCRPLERSSGAVPLDVIELVSHL